VRDNSDNNGNNSEAMLHTSNIFNITSNNLKESDQKLSNKKGFIKHSSHRSRKYKNNEIKFENNKK